MNVLRPEILNIHRLHKGQLCTWMQRRLIRHLYRIKARTVDLVMDTCTLTLVDGHLPQYILPYVGKEFWPYVVKGIPTILLTTARLLVLGDTVRAVLL